MQFAGVTPATGGNTSLSLPQDIFSVIIDILGSELDSTTYSRLKTLIALSLTCRLLLPLCQRHIFSAITLRTRIITHDPGTALPNQNERRIPSIDFKTFGRVLKRNLAVADYVRALNCQLLPSDFENVGIVDILHQFNRLQRLTINAHEHATESSGIESPEDDGHRDEYGFNGRCINWNDMSQNLQDAVKRLVSIPKLMTLKLGYFVNFPTTILATAAGLQTLNINRCRLIRIPPSALGPTTLSLTPIQIRELKFRTGDPSNVDMLKGWGHPIMDFAQIQKVSFKLQAEDDARQLGDLLNGMPNLETLSLGYIDWFPFNRPIIHGPGFRTLETLRHLRIRCEIPQYCYYWGVLCPPLEDAPSFNMLETLEINVKLYPGGYTPAIAGDLKDVDNEIRNASKFPSLKSVSIIVRLDHCDEPNHKGTSVLQSFNLPQAKRTRFYEASYIRLWLSLPTTHLNFLSNNKHIHLAYLLMDAVGDLIPTTIVDSESGIWNDSYMHFDD